MKLVLDFVRQTFGNVVMVHSYLLYSALAKGLFEYYWCWGLWEMVGMLLAEYRQGLFLHWSWRFAVAYAVRC